jgi:recombination protein RecA
MTKSNITKVQLHPKLATFQKAIDSRTKISKDVLVKPTFQLACVNTGSTVINMLAGGSRLPDGSFVCPGWPKGRIVEIFGRESSGKSTIALTAMAQAISNNGADDGCGLYVDLECAVIDNYAMKIGVDFRPPEMGGPGNAQRVQPYTFEQTEKLVMTAALNGVDIVVIDSVAGLTSEREVKRDVTSKDEKQGIAEVPRLMSNWLPQLQSVIARTGTLVIFLNQTRDKIGAKGFAEEQLKSTTGGNALKFWAAMRMLLTPKMSTKAKIFNPITRENEDVVIAKEIKCKMVKNKIDAKQDHAGLITIRYGVGIDELRTMLNVAEAYGVIKKKSSWVSFTAPECGREIKGAGMERFRASLSKDREALHELIKICTDHIVQGYRILDEETLTSLAEDAITKNEETDPNEYLHEEDESKTEYADEETAAAMVPEINLSGV